MNRIRIGNDFLVAWRIKRAGVSEDLSQAVNMSLVANVKSGGEFHSVIVPFEIIDNSIVRIEITPLIAQWEGIYNFVFKYEFDFPSYADNNEKCAVDKNIFSIVGMTAQADDITFIDCESDVLIGLKGEKGDNAFVVWQKENGADKTYQDWIDFLQHPATVAALLANEKAGEANEAAIAANDAAVLANQRAGEALSATTAANTAAGNANTATQAANSATTQTLAAKSATEQATTQATSAADLANEKAQLADEKATLANNAATLANSKATIADEKATEADNAAIAANEKAGYANTQGDFAKEQGELAQTARENIEGDLALKADLVDGTVPAEQLPPELVDTTLYVTNVAHRKRRIKDASEVEDSTALWTLVKGNDYLKALPDILGLGLYLVSQDLTEHKKLSKTNSNFYADGTPAILDGSEGDIQMCWRKPIYIKYYEKQEVDGLYEHFEISHLNILGDCEMIPPGGGFPGVMDRATSTLRALYSKDVNYRGGNNASVYDSDPVRTLLGKPASNLSAYSGEVAAKKRGDLWTSGGTPFFATLAILQIMLLGTNNSQAAIVTDDVLVDGEGFQKCKEAAEGLYSGGFGVNNSFPSWDVFNAYNPTFDLSAGFSKGDITGRRVYKINDWPTAGTSQTIQLAYFFGMPWPFNHMWFGDAHQRVDQQTEAQGFKTVVYQKRDITTVPISGGPCENGATPAAPWEKVAEAFRSNGYIRRVSFNALCIIPTLAAGAGASDKFYADYLYNNGETSFGWRAPLRFAVLNNGSNSGAFLVSVINAPTSAGAFSGAFCCHFSQPQAPKKISKN